MRSMFIIWLLVLAAIPLAASGDQPIEALQKGVQEGLRLLQDSKFNDVNLKDAQQQKLRLILEQLFDFREFSKLVLASHWKLFSAAQKDEFVRVFARFLGKFYMGKLQEKYKDETLIYVRQEFMSPARARVEVQVVWKGRKVPVELRMLKRSGFWKIYDIQAFGISAVRNYRAQFRSLLSKETPAQVIDLIKNKLEKMEQKRSKG